EKFLLGHLCKLECLDHLSFGRHLWCVDGNQQCLGSLQYAIIDGSEELQAGQHKVGLLAFHHHVEHPVDFFSFIPEKKGHRRIRNIFDREIVKLTFDQLWVDRHRAVVEYGCFQEIGLSEG